jgi:peptidoglycan/LPS O-acetylase OafA/YrhL
VRTVASRTPTYWRGLDGVRAIAISTVLVFHARLTLLPGGGAGVDVFFVLSGFLITLSLLAGRRASGRIGLTDFYKRRALRILPAMLVAVPFGAALTWLTWPAERHRLGSAAISSIAFIANFRAADAPASMSVFLPHWSLALEEQFYLLWPPVLFVLLLVRWRPQWVVALTAGAVVLAVAWRNVEYGHISSTAFLYRPDVRADPILLGCLLGLLVGFDLVPTAAWFRRAVQAAAVLGVGYIALFAYKTQWFPDRTRLTIALFGVSAATAVVILERVTAPTKLLSVVLEQPVLVWLGRISYSLYLVHVPIIVMVRRAIPGSASVLPAVTLSIVAGAALHYAVEAPFLRLKQRARQTLTTTADAEPHPTSPAHG